MRRLLIAILMLISPCLSFAGTAQVRAMMGMWGAASGAAIDLYRYPTGAGALVNWTPSGADTTWEAVDDAAGSADDDTTYMYKSDAVASESFDYPAFSIPPGTTITSVSVHYRCRYTSDTPVGVRPRIYVNGTLYNGADDSTIGASYSDASYAWTTNPNTTSAWTVDDVNGSGPSPLQDFAIEARGIVSGGTINCTQVYIKVNL